MRLAPTPHSRRSLTRHFQVTINALVLFWVTATAHRENMRSELSLPPLHIPTTHNDLLHDDGKLPLPALSPPPPIAGSLPRRERLISRPTCVIMVPSERCSCGCEPGSSSALETPSDLMFRGEAGADTFKYKEIRVSYDAAGHGFPSPADTRTMVTTSETDELEERRAGRINFLRRLGSIFPLSQSVGRALGRGHLSTFSSQVRTRCVC